MLWRGRTIVTEKGKRERNSHRAHNKNVFPKALAWKMRGAEFPEFLQPAGLNVLEF